MAPAAWRLNVLVLKVHTPRSTSTIMPATLLMGAVQPSVLVPPPAVEPSSTSTSEFVTLKFVGPNAAAAVARGVADADVTNCRDE